MNNVQFVDPRKTVEVILPDGRTIQADRGSSLESILRILADTESLPIVGAIVNGQLRELTYPVQMDAMVRPINMGDKDGVRIYRRSLTFLLSVAFQQLYPEGVLTIDHAVASGGYYCQVEGLKKFTLKDVEKLEKHMRSLVSKNLRFERKEVLLSEAIDYFRTKNQSDKVDLLKYRTKPYLVLYQLGDHRDYHHGYMVPSSGYLKYFKLVRANDESFILQYPRQSSPTEIQKLPDNPKLLGTFTQYGSWLKKLGIENVGELNKAITENKIRELILVSEAFHEMRIAEIARTIALDAERIKVVLIAGPSSSGKTTFSKRLSVQLLTQGVTPFPLEMDNYFVDREKTPRDEHGEYDFEALEALDLELLDEHVYKLINGEMIQQPKFDFICGKRLPGEFTRLENGQIILLEGIHGLNPRLLRRLKPEQTFRIYISCLTQLNLDRHNRISTTDSRMIRRIVRDARERGYTAQETIKRWESVGRGEKAHIFPFQENADVVMNSALVYELSALKEKIEPLLRQVPYGTSEHVEAKRLLSFLEWFLPLDTQLIPDNSILQEFLGGSIFKEFKIWQTKL